MGKLGALFLFLILLSPNAYANDYCDDSEILGAKLFDSFCYNCYQNIYVMGRNISQDFGKSGIGRPDGSKSTGAVCSCMDDFGVPQFGFPVGYWSATHLVEVVRKDWCSPVLGKSLSGDPTFAKSAVRKMEMKDNYFKQVNVIAFPAEFVMELMFNSSCSVGGAMDLDIASSTAPLSTWKDETLALYSNPLSSLAMDVASSITSLAECGMLWVSDQTFGAAGFLSMGCYGNTYPLVGHAYSGGSPVSHSSLVASRAMMQMHNFGQMWETMGSKAMCEDEKALSLNKARYRKNLLYPKPEAKSNHVIGKPTILWGEHRSGMSGPSDYVYTFWRFRDCCVR